MLVSARLFSVTIFAMKLRPEIEFHEDIRLLIYKPHGLINETAMNEVIGVIEDLEAKSPEPFNRFADTVAADEVELNFQIYYSSISASAPCLRRSPGEVGNSRYRFDNDSLYAFACHTNSGFSYQRSCFPRSTRSCGLARRACRTAERGDKRLRLNQSWRRCLCHSRWLAAMRNEVSDNTHY